MEISVLREMFYIYTVQYGATIATLWLLSP